MFVIGFLLFVLGKICNIKEIYVKLIFGIGLN